MPNRSKPPAPTTGIPWVEAASALANVAIIGYEFYKSYTKENEEEKIVKREKERFEEMEKIEQEENKRQEERDEEMKRTLEREDEARRQREREEEARRQGEREELKKELSEMKALNEELRRKVQEATVGGDRSADPTAPTTGVEPWTASVGGSKSPQESPKLPQKPKLPQGRPKPPQEGPKPAQGKPISPQSSAQLPALCHQHWKKQGCKKSACGQVHLCKLFLAGICKFGNKCRNSHSLTSEHNKRVCSEETVLAEENVIQELQQRFVKEGVVDQGFYRSHLEICRKQDGTCLNCIRIHICSQYVRGSCPSGYNCGYGHTVRTEHNIRVLRLHRAVKLNDLAIIELLSANPAPRSGNAARKGPKSASKSASADQKGARGTAQRSAHTRPTDQ